MDIKDNLTDQDKALFENLRIEIMVLEYLLKEKRALSEQHLASVFQRLGINPALYGLEWNAAQDKWETKLRPDALVTPGGLPAQMLNRQMRRHPEN